MGKNPRILSVPVACSLFTNRKNRYFDRSRSQSYRERRAEKSASLPHRFKVRTAHLPLLAGCPIHRAVCDGWNHRGSCCRRCLSGCHPHGDLLLSLYRSLSVLSLSPNPATVISTEAPHGFIVRRAVEKSAVLFAFRPFRLLSQNSQKTQLSF